MKSTFFLDRDGVINTGGFVNSIDDFAFIPGSLEAIALLSKQGHPLFIMTNQGGVEAGFLTEDTLKEIHDSMINQIRKFGGWVQKIYYCPHLKEACDCRKPKPGMLQHAQKEFQIDFSNAYFVGDYLTDWQAAMAVGVTPIAVRTGRYKEPVCQEFIKENSIKTFENLLDVAKVLGGSEPF